MARIQVQIIGNPIGVTNLFYQMEQSVGLAQISEFLRDDIDPYIRTRVANRFAGEGDDVSGPWLPLAPATQSIRASRGYFPSHPINVRDHFMRDFLVGQPGRVTTSGMEAVLTHPDRGDPLTEQKIRTAQQGKSYPKTPPRPVIGLNAVDLDYIHIRFTAFMFRTTP